MGRVERAEHPASRFLLEGRGLVGWDGWARSIIHTPWYGSDVGVYTRVSVEVNRHTAEGRGTSYALKPKDSMFVLVRTMVADGAPVGRSRPTRAHRGAAAVEALGVDTRGKRREVYRSGLAAFSLSRRGVIHV